MLCLTLLPPCVAILLGYTDASLASGHATRAARLKPAVIASILVGLSVGLSAAVRLSLGPRVSRFFVASIVLCCLSYILTRYLVVSAHVSAVISLGWTFCLLCSDLPAAATCFGLTVIVGAVRVRHRLHNVPEVFIAALTASATMIMVL